MRKITFHLILSAVAIPAGAVAQDAALLTLEAPKAGATSVIAHMVCGMELRHCSEALKPQHVAVEKENVGFEVDDPGRSKRLVIHVANPLKTGQTVSVTYRKDCHVSVSVIPADADVSAATSRPQLYAVSAGASKFRYRWSGAVLSVDIVDAAGFLRDLNPRPMQLGSGMEYEVSLDQPLAPGDTIHLSLSLNDNSYVLLTKQLPREAFPSSAPRQEETAQAPAPTHFPGSSLTPPSILGGLLPGKTFDALLAAPLEGRGDIQARVNGKDAGVDDVVIKSGRPLTVGVSLGTKLMEGDRVEITQSGSAPSNVVTVGAAPLPPSPPTNIKQITEGDSVVSGDGTSGLDQVRVEILEGDHLIDYKVVDVDKAGGFSASFDKTKVLAEQRVQVFGVKGGQTGAPVTQEIQPVDFDYGRVTRILHGGRAALQKERRLFQLRPVS